MTKTHILTQTRYSKLVKDVRRLIEEGKARATQAANQELVVTYWHIGKRISEEMLTDNAGYAQAVLEDLSDELGIDVSTLKRSLYFFQIYKSAPRSTNLQWSHYKHLLALSDDREREWYEELVESKGLNRDQLAQAIKEGRYFEHKKGRKATKKLKRPTDATYVYKALVEHVVDGDTLLLRIDLGFQVWKEQRVRLAGIDTPSMDSPDGKAAYRFVRDQLAQADFVMVKTDKIDIYGRYVGHIFYDFGQKNKSKVFTQGRHLNLELLNQGFAVAL